MARRDLQLEVKGRQVVIPNAVMTVILVGVTALLFMLMDNPDTAVWASMGFALVVMVAKALQINYTEVLGVLGKDEGDLPPGIDPLMSPNMGPVGGPQEVVLEEKGKVRTFLLG